MPERHRNHAGNQREGRHQDRPEPRPARLDNREVPRRAPLLVSPTLANCRSAIQEVHVKKMALLVLPLLIVLDGCGPAQGQSSAEATVRSLDDEERIAALKRDTTALERLWSDQFVANGPNNKVVADKRALLTALVPRSSYVRQIEFVRVDGDFSFIMGLETLVAVTDAPSVGLVAGQPTRRRFTHVWKREGDTWRLYARHANVIAER